MTVFGTAGACVAIAAVTLVEESVREGAVAQVLFTTRRHGDKRSRAEGLNMMTVTVRAVSEWYR